MIESGEYIKDIFQKLPGTPVSAHGWVKTRRDSKGVTFIQLSDGSTFGDLQVVVDAGTIPDDVLTLATTGACLKIDGELVESPGSGQSVELKARAIHIFGASESATYPMQKKGHTMEFLREKAHLRPRSNTFGAVFRVRNAVSFAIHKFFQERGFLYLTAPLITTNDAEGAGAQFQVTTLDLMNLPRTSDKQQIDWSRDFFGKPAHLSVSGQLEAEIFALAFTNVYTFGPTFRAENSNTPRHLAEFWMIEPEMAFCDLDGDRRLAEQFLKYVLAYVLENCGDDLRFFNDRIDETKTLLTTLEHVAAADFEHVTYTEAVKILENTDRAWEFPVQWGVDLQAEHERYLTEEVFKRPIVVTDYPREIKAFYMRLNEDEKTVRAMDVLVPRIGEIIGGSQREERHDVLRDKVRAQGIPEESLWWYLELRKYGTAPHAGFGLGLERLVMYITGIKNIRDVIPFPRTPGYAEF